MFSCIFEDFLHFLWRLFLSLVMFALFGYAVHGFMEMAKSDNPISSISNFYFVYAAIGAGTILFVILYLGRIASVIVDSLFGGKTYLSRAPRTYGALTGYIASRNFKEADAAIQKTKRDPVSKRDPLFARIVMEYYADTLQQPERAWDFGVSFFRWWPYVQPGDSLYALLILDDLGRQLGKQKTSRRILAWELHRLPKADQTLLKRRLEAK